MQNAYNKRGMLVVDAEIPAYGVEAIDFFDLKPNYFRVQNKGTTKVYCGISKVPTDETYDFYCKGESFSMYAEPHGTGYLNIYNPSGSPVKVRVLGFAAAFDPLALAFSQIEIDLSDLEITSSGSIDEFKTSLPAGTNKIGSVGISGALPAGTNNIGKVGVASLPATAPTLEKQEEIVNLINNYNRKYAHFKSGNATTAGVVYESDATICHIGFISNDGESDITMSITESDGTVNSIIVKPGEVINHIDCLISSIKISGSGAFRLVYIERNGG